MLQLAMHTQPDDESCGPTSLHAIYQFYNLDIPLNTLVETIPRSLSGGTYASFLGQDALNRGFDTELYVNNVTIFDPSWFEENGTAERVFLINKLTMQMEHKRTPIILQASQAYLDYLRLDGKVFFKTINSTLLKTYFNAKIPVLAGLSATYLYRSMREVFTDHGESLFDDIKGMPCGHFVVLCGYDEHHRSVVVADPHRENPLSHDNYYKVSINRLINAIMLGVITDDANLLIIQPKTLCKQS